MCFCFVYGNAQPKKNLKKPNVLFIIADDLTATVVSSYENIAANTPHIDRLAAEGTKYTRAYTQYPVCGPSRASLMFGYYPNATTTYGYVSGRKNVGPSRKSLSQLFKDNGYYTARVSKIYHMGVPGGVEAGETLIEAALRELDEETGLRLPAETLRPFGQVQSQSARRSRLFVFTATLDIGPADIRLGEGAGFAFLGPAQVRALPLVPVLVPLIWRSDCR